MFRTAFFLSFVVGFANSASATEITMDVYSNWSTHGRPLDFSNKQTFSEITNMEFLIGVSYFGEISESPIDHIDFTLGGLRFDNLPVEANFTGFYELQGDVYQSYFTLRPLGLSLSEEDYSLLLSEIEDDAFLPWSATIPEEFHHTIGVGIPSIGGIHAAVTGTEGVPGTVYVAAQVPEPSSLLVWAGGLFVFGSWRWFRKPSR